MANKRGRNFDDFEKNLVIELVNEYKDIIENKKTDGVTVKAKNKAWEEITVKYNASCRTGPRNAKQMHALYDCLKKSARKELSNDKMELYKTGGGVFVPKLSDVSSKIVNMLRPQFEPLKTAYDSAANYFGDDNVIFQIEEEASTSTHLDVVGARFEPENIIPPVVTLTQPAVPTISCVPIVTPLRAVTPPPLTVTTPPLTVTPPPPVTPTLTPVPTVTPTVTPIQNRKQGSLAKKRNLANIKIKKEELKIRVIEEEHRIKIKHMEEEHKIKIEILKHELKLKELEVENKLKQINDRKC